MDPDLCNDNGVALVRFPTMTLAQRRHKHDWQTVHRSSVPSSPQKLTPISEDDNETLDEITWADDDDDDSVSLAVSAPALRHGRRFLCGSPKKVSGIYSKQKRKDVNRRSPGRQYPHKLSPHRQDPHSWGPHRQDPHKHSPHRQDPHKLSPHRLGPHKHSPHRQDPHKLSPHRLGPHKHSPHRQDPHKHSPHRQDPHKYSAHRQPTHNLSPHRHYPRRHSPPTQDPSRQNKSTPESVLSTITDQLSADEDLCKWSNGYQISPRSSPSTQERLESTENVRLTGKPTKSSSVDFTDVQKRSSIKTHIHKNRLPIKAKSSVTQFRKQTGDRVMKQFLSKYSAKENARKNPQPRKFFCGLRKSQSERHRQKFTRKTGHDTSMATVSVRKEKNPHALLAVNSSHVDSESCSSEADKTSDQHPATNNLSDSSVVFQRDSWIWFSPETRPSADNFASRQRKFRSQDPRVAALAEEIRRQEELNRDIEKTAESLIDSSSHSTGMGAKCRPNWQAGRCRMNRGNVYRKFSTAPCTNYNKMSQMNPSDDSLDRCKLIASHSWCSSHKASPYLQAGTSTRREVGKPRFASMEYPSNFPNKSNRKLGGVKMPGNSRRKKISVKKTLLQKADNTQSLPEAGDSKICNGEMRSLRQHIPGLKHQADAMSRFPSQLVGSANLRPAGELVESANLRPAGLFYASQSKSLDRDTDACIPDITTQAAWSSGVNCALNAPTFRADSQYSSPRHQSRLVNTDMFMVHNAKPLKSRRGKEKSELGEAAVQTSNKQKCSRASQNTLRSQVGPQKHKLLLESQSARSSLKPQTDVQLQWSADAVRTTGSGCPESRPTFAEKCISKVSMRSLKEQSPSFENHCRHLICDSNLRASQKNVSALSNGIRSQPLVPSPGSDTVNKERLELGHNCLEEIINTEVRAIVYKLLLESGLAAVVPTGIPNNTRCQTKYPNDETKNIFFSESAGGTDIPKPVHESPGPTRESLSEPTDSAKSPCTDTYLLDPTHSQCSQQQQAQENLSISETTRKLNRINIYTKAYYLGKRGRLKTKDTHFKTPSQTAASTSLSKWKKPYITWSKTVSMHLYSPSNKLSAGNQTRQKKYAQYMRKLKPCLKVQRKLVEKCPKSVSVMEGTCSESSCAPDLAADDVFGSRGNVEGLHLETPCSSTLNQNLPQQDTVKHGHSKEDKTQFSAGSCQIENNGCLSVENNDCLAVENNDCLSLASRQIQPPISTTVAMRKPARFRGANSGASSACTTSNYCKKARDSVVTLSNNNSCSSTFLYQSSTPALCKTMTVPPAQVGQLYFATQANALPDQTRSQTNDCQPAVIYNLEHRNDFHVHGQLRKRRAIMGANLPDFYPDNSSHLSLSHNTNELFYTPTDYFCFFQHKHRDKPEQGNYVRPRR